MWKDKEEDEQHRRERGKVPRLRVPWKQRLRRDEGAWWSGADQRGAVGWGVRGACAGPGRLRQGNRCWLEGEGPIHGWLPWFNAEGSMST